MEQEALKVNVAALSERELVVSRTGEKLSLARSLSDAFGLEKLLVHQETLLPGRRASGFHFHSEKEEIFYVLSGRPSVRVGERTIDLEPGDAVGFKPSAEAPHMLFNRSREPAVVLTIGSNSDTDIVTYLDQDVFAPTPRKQVELPVPSAKPLGVGWCYDGNAD